MPILKIEVLEGFGRDRNMALMQNVKESLKSAFAITDKDCILRLYEVPRDYFILDDHRSEEFTLIEITMFPGRSEAEKKCLTEQMTTELGREFKILPDDVCLIIHEPPLENRAIGGILQSDLF